MNQIKAIRERKGMSQEDLAKLMGVTQGAVWQWENGLTFPKTGLLVKLADVLNVKVDELLREHK